MGDKQNQEDKPFKVTDRRVSQDSSQAKAEEAPARPSPKKGQQEQTTEPPELDFNTFVLSLSTSALMHLGAAPETNIEVNLPLARQTIDCLALLEEKTKGNLSGEEERLLTEILYDLRMRYVASAKKTT